MERNSAYPHRDRSVFLHVYSSRCLVKVKQFVVHLATCMKSCVQSPVLSPVGAFLGGRSRRIRISRSSSWAVWRIWDQRELQKTLAQTTTTTKKIRPSFLYISPSFQSTHIHWVLEGPHKQCLMSDRHPDQCSVGFILLTTGLQGMGALQPVQCVP